MGHVKVRAVIWNPEKTKSKEVEALVDTGATLSVIPEKIAEEVGLKDAGEVRVRTAAGTIKHRKAEARVEIGGKEAIQEVLISNIIDKVLIGAVTLEVLALIVDPLTGELKESELLLYLDFL